MVIALDDEITEELKREGYARDLVRFIQEARKEADYSIDDRIKVSVNGLDGIDEFKGYIENETLSKFEDFSDADLTKDIEIENIKVTISIKK
jgi:isoleucyl-tRNA synthetase